MKLLVALVTLLYVSQHALGVQVEVYEGAESVRLPCQVNVSVFKFNAVSWSVERLSDKIVHQRVERGDILDGQNQDYRGRTSMRTDALMTGELSLILRNPTTRDSETYTCIIREGLKEKSRHQVHLKVTEPPTPAWVYVVSVLVSLLVVAAVAAVAAVCLYRFKKWDEGRVLQVKVESGAESVLLPFNRTDTWWAMRCCIRRIRAHLSKAVRVEWVDEHNMAVHVYQNGPKEQDQVFRGRTEMKKDLMKTGDFSLILRHPTVRDTGDYYCRVYNKDGDLLEERAVELKVKVKQVVVKEGAESVLLPVKPIANLPEDVTVKWTNISDRNVHVYKGSLGQDQVYRGRTEMNEDLKTGDFSLILKHPTVTDRGVYSCRVYNMKGVLLRETGVELQVTVQQVEEEEGAESVLLPVKTTADLPEDVTVEWMDRDNRKVHVYRNGSLGQDQVYRGRTEMKKDLMKTGDFSLILRHLRVTDTGFYYCRVYNKDGDLLRETGVELKVTEKKKPSTPGTEATPLVGDEAV